jgi:hypothetical protein
MACSCRLSAVREYAAACQYCLSESIAVSALSSAPWHDNGQACPMNEDLVSHDVGNLRVTVVYTDARPPRGKACLQLALTLTSMVSRS